MCTCRIQYNALHASSRIAEGTAVKPAAPLRGRGAGTRRPAPSGLLGPCFAPAALPTAVSAPSGQRPTCGQGQQHTLEGWRSLFCKAPPQTCTGRPNREQKGRPHQAWRHVCLPLSRRINAFHSHTHPGWFPTSAPAVMVSLGVAVSLESGVPCSPTVSRWRHDMGLRTLRQVTSPTRREETLGLEPTLRRTWRRGPLFLVREESAGCPPSAPVWKGQGPRNPYSQEEVQPSLGVLESFLTLARVLEELPWNRRWRRPLPGRFLPKAPAAQPWFSTTVVLQVGSPEQQPQRHPGTDEDAEAQRVRAA